ncbi:MAG: hypothetical protein ACKUBY_04230 [Candidatus Moraniibacteriota bacterium]|jgi:hypothetical protein
MKRILVGLGFLFWGLLGAFVAMQTMVSITNNDKIIAILAAVFFSFIGMTLLCQKPKRSQ